MAATDSSDTLADFSNYGDCVDVCAPGVGIYSSMPGNSYANLDGTSMASPAAAAAVALLLSLNSDLTPLEIREYLRNTADPVLGGKNAMWLYGAGIVNLSTSGPVAFLEEARLVTGEQKTLIPLVMPPREKLDWTFVSGNHSVATVSPAGVVTAIAKGKTAVTATASANGKTYTVSCEVTVLGSLLGISIERLPDPYYLYFIPEEEEFSTAGGALRLEYEDGVTDYIPITKSMCSGYVMNDFRQQTITVTYKEKTTSFEITAGAPLEGSYIGYAWSSWGYDSRSLFYIPQDSVFEDETDYAINPCWRIPGTDIIKWTTVWLGHSDHQKSDAVLFSGYDTSVLGRQMARVEYYGLSNYFPIDVYTADRAWAKAPKELFVRGDTFSTGGAQLIVGGVPTAIAEDMCTGYDMNEPGCHSVRVDCGGTQALYQICVIDPDRAEIFIHLFGIASNEAWNLFFVPQGKDIDYSEISFMLFFDFDTVPFDVFTNPAPENYGAFYATIPGDPSYFSGIDPHTFGRQTMTISYPLTPGHTLQKDFSVEVCAPVRLDANLWRYQYSLGEELERGRLSLTYERQDGTSVTSGIDFLPDMISGYDRNKPGKQTVTVSCMGLTAEFEVTVTDPQHEHSYSEWMLRAPATCTEEGVEVCVCTYCGEEETRPLAPLGHDYAAATIPPTCTEQGYTTCTCARCGHSYADDYVRALGHDWDEWEVTVPATDENEGTETRVCLACGEEETRPTAPLGHTYAGVTTPPTCTEQGYTTYTCAGCGHSYADDYVAALGHDWGSWMETKPATYFEEGFLTRVCSRAPSHVETNTIPILDHMQFTQKNVTVDYRGSFQLSFVGPNAEGYTWQSSNSAIRVDSNGQVTSLKSFIKTASATITVKDAQGNVMDTCQVSVKPNFLQWLMIIFLFGWIWM